MKRIVMKGKTVDEAVAAAIQVLGIDKEKAGVRVINEGKGGVLGFIGGEEAEVEVTEKEAMDKIAQSVIQEILDKMGFTAIVKQSGMDGDRILYEIFGEDMGRIIGKDGAALNALQLLASTVASNIAKERIKISIDAEGYRQKRGRAIERLAQETINDVERLGVEKMLPPMSAADRRVVHLLIKKHPKLASFSVGDRKDRRVVITLAENAPKGGLGRGALDAAAEN